MQGKGVERVGKVGRVMKESCREGVKWGGYKEGSVGRGKAGVMYGGGKG